MLAHQLEVPLGRFFVCKVQCQQGARRVVNVYVQRTRGSTIFKPTMVRSIDLSQFAKTRPSGTRRMMGAVRLTSRFPKARYDHGASERLVIDAQVMPFQEFLRCERRTTIA